MKRKFINISNAETNEVNYVFDISKVSTVAKRGTSGLFMIIDGCHDTIEFDTKEVRNKVFDNIFDLLYKMQDNQ